MSRLARVWRARTRCDNPAAPRSTSDGSASAETWFSAGDCCARKRPDTAHDRMPANTSVPPDNAKSRTIFLQTTVIRSSENDPALSFTYNTRCRIAANFSFLFDFFLRKMVRRQESSRSDFNGKAAVMFIRRLCGVLFAAWCVLNLAVPAGLAQSQSINGSVRGRVTDPANAAVPDAQVTGKNDDTGFERSQSTNEDGYYMLPNLPLGTYTVTVQKQGFEAQRRPGVLLNAGSDVTIDANLVVGSVSTMVDVSGGAPVVDPAQVNIGRTISFEEVDNLPLTSRNPYNFILFQPGVSGHPNPELGIPRTLNTNGLLDRINYQLDGMVDTETDRYGLRLFPISD